MLQERVGYIGEVWDWWCVGDQVLTLTKFSKDTSVCEITGGKLLDSKWLNKSCKTYRTGRAYSLCVCPKQGAQAEAFWGTQGYDTSGDTTSHLSELGLKM